MTETYITESYLRRQIEGNAFAKIASILNDLCFTVAGGDPVMSLDEWEDHARIYAHFRREVKAFEFRFAIEDRFYRPGGKVTRSQPKGVSQANGSTGQYTSIRNGGNEPIEHEIDKTVTLEHSQSSSLSKGIQLDLTASASGGFAGVTASLETHLGVSVNSEEAESTTSTKSTTFSDKVTVDPGEEVAIVYSKTSKRYSQDFVIDAVADCAFWLDIYHWAGAHSGPNAKYLLNSANQALWSGEHEKTHYWTRFKSIHDFCGFIRGYDVRAPEMKWYLNHAYGGARQHLVELEKADVLGLKLTGTDDIVHEGDADYSVEDIKGMDDDAVREAFGKKGAPLPQGKGLRAQYGLMPYHAADWHYSKGVVQLGGLRVLPWS